MDSTTIETLFQLLADPDDRLRLRTKLRPASVSGDSTDTNNVSLLVDGDEFGSTSYGISLVGHLVKDQRVMVMFVPPHGAYIVGVIGGATPLLQEQSIRQQSLVGSTTNVGTLVNWPTTNPLVLTFTKQLSVTDLSIDIGVTFFVNVAGGIAFAVNINGTDTANLIPSFTNVANSHIYRGSNATRIASIPAGPVTITLRAACTPGIVLNSDANDYNFIVVREVVPVPTGS